MALISAIISFVTGLIGFFTRASEQKTGATKQVAVEAVATAKTETAIAQAEANAPSSRQAVADELGKGTF